MRGNTWRQLPNQIWDFNPYLFWQAPTGVSKRAHMEAVAKSGVSKRALMEAVAKSDVGI